MAISTLWAQLVRRPGACQVLGHHDIDVPPLAGETPVTPARPGKRLMVRPISPTNEPWIIDVTSTQALAMLEGFLGTGVHFQQRLGWRSRGFGVHRRDTLHLRPLTDEDR